MGRVGVLKTKHGDVKTPALMPVIHPRKQAIDVGRYGADIVITNAYLIYKDEDRQNESVHAVPSQLPLFSALHPCRLDMHW